MRTISLRSAQITCVGPRRGGEDGLYHRLREVKVVQGNIPSVYIPYDTCPGEVSEREMATDGYIHY